MEFLVSQSLEIVKSLGGAAKDLMFGIKNDFGASEYRTGVRRSESH